MHVLEWEHVGSVWDTEIHAVWCVYTVCYPEKKINVACGAISKRQKIWPICLEQLKAIKQWQWDIWDSVGQCGALWDSVGLCHEKVDSGVN